MAIVTDRTNGEITVHGKRHAVTDVREFCRRLDLLVGPIIAAVQMHSLEAVLGKNDIERIRKEMPKATIKELIDALIEMDNVSGLGVTSVSADANHGGPIQIETSNPLVASVNGAASAFQPGWWCGAMSSLLGRPLDVRNILCNNEENVLRFQLVTRKGYDALKSNLR